MADMVSNTTIFPTCNKMVELDYNFDVLNYYFVVLALQLPPTVVLLIKRLSSSISSINFMVQWIRNARDPL